MEKPFGMSEIQQSATAKNLKLSFSPLVTNILTEGGQTAKIALEIKNTSNKSINLYANEKGNTGADSFTFCIEFPIGVLKKTVNQSQESSQNFSSEQTIGNWKVRTSENIVYFLATSAQVIESQKELKLEIGKLFVNRDSTSTQVTLKYRHTSSAAQSKEQLKKDINQTNIQVNRCNNNVKRLNQRIAAVNTNIKKQNNQLTKARTTIAKSNGLTKNIAKNQAKRCQSNISNLQKKNINQKANIQRQNKLKAQLVARRTQLQTKLKSLPNQITVEEFTQSHFVTLDQTKAPLEMSATVHGTLLNTGSDNTVVIYLVNTSRNEIEFTTKSTLQIAFKKGTNEPHALTNQDETTTNITVNGFTVEQNQTALDPTYDLKCTKKIELQPEQFIKITIANLKTTLSPRIGFLYIDYEKIADYRDGRMIVPISIGSAKYRQSDSALLIYSKYIDVNSPNQIMLYNQGIRARKNFLLNTDAGLNLTVKSGQDLVLQSTRNIGINANGGKNNVGINAANITLKGKTTFDGNIEFKNKANSESTGLASSDYARIYGAHVKNTETSSLVFELGDNENDTFVFRNKIHNKPAKDVLKINYNGIYVSGRKPFLLKQYTDVKLNKNYNTNVDSNVWDAIIAGWDGTFDIREGGKHNNSTQMYISGGKWHIDVDFAAHSGTENATIKVNVLFIRKELTERQGVFG